MPAGGESTGIPGKRSLTEELSGPSVALGRPPFPLLVEDEPQPHQMMKADFLGRLEQALQGFARTLSPAGCPLLERYLAHYHAASASHCELVIHRWLPDWRDAVDASALLERVLRHAKRAIQDWCTRGAVPPELDRGGSIQLQTDGRIGDGDGSALDRRSARGLASADSILLRDDASLETLAHELVHQEQAQLPVELDRGRDAAELEAASLAHQVATTGTRSEARYALDLSAAAADSDAKEAKPASRLNGRPFAVEGDASNPRIYVSSGWIASQGVPRGHLGEITGRTHPGVFRRLLEAVLPLYPYASQRGVDPLSSIPRLTLRLSEELWKTGEQDLGIGRTLFLTLGLPPTQSVQVFPTNDGIEIYADTAYTYPADGDDARRTHARQALVMLAADGVEKRLGAKLDRARRARLEGELDQIFAHQDDKVVRATISMEVLAEFFGPETLRDYANASPTEGGGVIVIRGEALLLLARDEAERQKVIALLTELFGEAKPATPGTEGQVILPLDIEALLAFDKDPRRKELLEILRSQRQDPSRDKSSWNATQVRDALANARETLEIRDANKKLGRESRRDEDTIEGLLPYPVPGEIVNLSDHINLGMRAEFEFRSTGTSDPREWRFADPWFFHQPEADIDWYAVEVDAAGQPKGAPEKHERIHYREAKPDSWINDRRFEHQFKRAGLYEIHAYVSHSMFQPAHFQDTVEILTEEERLGRFEHERSERWGVETRRTDKVFRGMDFNRRDGVSDNEELESARDQDAHAYARGTRAEGRLADETANDPEGGANQEVDRLEHEIEELEALEAQYPGDDRRSRSMRDYAEERRERLEASVERVKAGLGDREARPVQVQGNFASRTHGVSSGPLNLVAFFRRQGSRYAGELLDHSELVRAEHFRFRREAAQFEPMMEALFDELTRAYPDGSMSFAFQVYDALQPTDRFVRFTRKTDTVEKDFKEVAYDDKTRIAVNLISLLLTLFPPTAPLGIGLGLIYNGYEVLSELDDALRTDTVTTSKVVDVGLLALDILPVVGALSKTARIGKTTYHLIEATQLAGSVYLLADGVQAGIVDLRDRLINRLADKHQELARIRQLNPSSPEAAQLALEIRGLESDVRAAAKEVFTKVVASQGLQLASQSVVRHLAGGILTRPDADTDGTPHDAPPPADGSGTRGADVYHLEKVGELKPAGLKNRLSNLKQERRHARYHSEGELGGRLKVDVEGGHRIVDVEYVLVPELDKDRGHDGNAGPGEADIKPPRIPAAIGEPRSRSPASCASRM